MNPIKRELLNGLLVLVLASLMSAAFAAFQVRFNVQLWVLILIGVGIAVSGYIVFEVSLKFMASAEEREKEWLRRIGTPARLEFYEGRSGLYAVLGVVETMSPGNDYTVLYYTGPEGGGELPLGASTGEIRPKLYSVLLEQLKQGRLREYKRIMC